MKEKYIEDLREIRGIMERSTRFISLSGLSGVSTGIVALAGAYAAYMLVFSGQDYLVYNASELKGEALNRLLVIVAVTLVLSIGAAIFFTKRKAGKQNRNVWDMQTKRLLVNLAIPLFSGGLLCLMLLFKGFVGLLPPLTLIFYGLALVNGSKYTLPEIRNLGIIEIVVGLIAAQFIEYGLVCWALGFGVIQLVYGLIVQKKYK